MIVIAAYPKAKPMPKKPIVLRHKATGEFYRASLLGGDTRTANVESARRWATFDAAWRFSRRFGDRYEVLDTREDQP